MDQRNETFVPHVLAIVAGTTVDFPNSDQTYHNVFSLSKTKSFDLGRYAVGRSKSVRFDRPGIVRVFCDIHSHMSAFILVFSHRYFSVVDDEGRYRLENVPPGTYTVVAWNESAPLESRLVVVCGSGRRRRDQLRARAPMKSFSSLTNRIFFASALLAVLTIGLAVLPRERGRHRAGRKRAAARRRGGRHAARRVPHDLVRAFHSRGAARRRPVEAEGGG